MGDSRRPIGASPLEEDPFRGLQDCHLVDPTSKLALELRGCGRGDAVCAPVWKELAPHFIFRLGIVASRAIEVGALEEDGPGPLVPCSEIQFC